MLGAESAFCHGLVGASVSMAFVLFAKLAEVHAVSRIPLSQSQTPDPLRLTRVSRTTAARILSFTITALLCTLMLDTVF
jgi:hypothetical protein